jgi:hypothetical protein
MEPWVDLASESQFLHWSKADLISNNQRLRQQEKYRAFCLIFDMLAENQISGDYFEFGCHRVRTFRMALTEARKRDLHDMHFYAFDSFEGLPDVGAAESLHPLWVKGALCTSVDEFWKIVRSHGIYLDNIHAIKGFYSESLRLCKSDILVTKRSAAFINVDCDFYESAIEALDFSIDFLRQGTVIYVDDFFAGYESNTRRGVAKAFSEFSDKVSAAGWELVPHMQVGWWGKTFICSSTV